jgi:hypothetical protein
MDLIRSFIAREEAHAKRIPLQFEQIDPILYGFP